MPLFNKIIGHWICHQKMWWLQNEFFSRSRRWPLILRMKSTQVCKEKHSGMWVFRIYVHVRFFSKGLYQGKNEDPSKSRKSRKERNTWQLLTRSDHWRFIKKLATKAYSSALKDLSWIYRMFPIRN